MNHAKDPRVGTNQKAEKTQEVGKNQKDKNDQEAVEGQKAKEEQKFKENQNGSIDKQVKDDQKKKEVQQKKPRHWQAIVDADFHEYGNYEKFFRDLYAVEKTEDYKEHHTKALKAENINDLTESPFLMNSLLYHEMAMLSKEIETGDVQVDGAENKDFMHDKEWNHPRLRNAIYNHPFSLKGVPNSSLGDKPKEISVAEDRGWSYLEMAYRLRMLWAQLWHAANTVSNSPKANYLVEFFGRLPTEKNALGFPTTFSLFPMDIREKLIHNQETVNKVADVYFDETEYLSPFFINKSIKNADEQNMKADAQQGNQKEPESSDFSPYITRYGGELIIPWFQEIEDPQYGPCGPLSLEANFILSLQLAGIDLARVAKARKKKSGPPPLYTAGKLFPAPKERKDSLKDLYSAPSVVFPDITNKTFNAREINTTTVGLYCGIDFEEEGEKTGVKKTSSKTGERYKFGFVCHPIDIETRKVLWDEANIVDFRPKILNGGSPQSERSFYILNGEEEIPSVNNHYTQGKSNIRNEAPWLPRGEMKYPGKIGSLEPKDDNEKNNQKRVRPHCHQVFWSKDAFESTFKDLDPWSEAYGDYKNPLGMHLYMISEIDDRYTRASWWKVKRDWETQKEKALEKARAAPVVQERPSNSNPSKSQKQNNQPKILPNTNKQAKNSRK